MSLIVTINGLFTREAIAASFDRLPPQKSAVIDGLFPNTDEYLLATVPLSEFNDIVGTMPLVRRGGQPINISGGQADYLMVTPRPLKPSLPVLASELNDLKTILGDRASRESFIDRKVDILRRRIRASAEAMAAVVATTGKLVWPSRLEGGGHESFELDYGQILTFAPPKMWNAAGTVFKDIYMQLTAMQRTIEEEGGGSNVKFLAGTEVFESLLQIAETWKSTAAGTPVSVRLEKDAIFIGQFEIRCLAERYRSPLDEKQWVDKIAPKAVLAYSADNPGKIIYPAIDSMSNNNKPTAFHVVAEPIPGDSGVNLIGQAKPMPVRDPKSLLLATVVS